ncbi:succinyl-diaminopimelate desuccinylase [Naumannella halotolerans]|uniref:Succinyl-diaminopimelate desuccinylase n=1 Tax=Naumannella halotolerans TaxID=993414 RepID=A0A4R7J5N7_9ACTN|nr:succinyl-diaminopimelate desuccinylase [Naumannella halotolerans]TDT32671.1 succinyl-diaminopimelate desuccinylase [Naumannella halotolerans]
MPEPVELDLTADVVDLLRRLIDIESVSGDERRIADAVEQALRGLPGLEVSRDGDCVVARSHPGTDAGRVVIAGHLDTVPVADNLPSCVQIVDGEEMIFGRGSCDMKGGVAVQLSVAAALAAAGADHRPVTWIFYDNEEVEAEKNGLGRLARNSPDLLAGEFAVLCEPSNAGIEGGCQGTMRIEVRLSGTASHSARSWVGSNAIHAAAPVLQRLADYTPRQPVVDGLTYHEGLNAVFIDGGIAGNVIPDSCVVTINHRFAPDRDPAAAEAHLREVFAGFDVTVTDSAAGARPGLDQPIAAEFTAAVGGTPGPKYGWTDVSRFSALGVPAVNFGPGDPMLAHTDNEHTPSAQVRACREALLRWLAG